MTDTQTIPGLRYGEFQGFPVLLLESPLCKAAISLFGAHLMSFRPKSEAGVLQQDLLWLSPMSKKPPEGIRGGVPICWPWFAKQGQSPEAQQHGLVRRINWQVTRAAQHEDGTIDLNFTPSAYDHPLTVNFSMRLGRVFSQALTTVNLTETSHTFTQAFHTYFKVGDARQISVSGLEGLRFSDKFAGMVEKTQTGAFSLPADDPCSDRIYHQTGGDFVLIDPVMQRKIRVYAESSKTLVVWNPGATHVQNFTDIAHDQWPDYVCLEVANAGEEVITLAPNESAQMLQTVGLI
jgi:glucose-6-phosphate 1-epimerase